MGSIKRLLSMEMRKYGIIWAIPIICILFFSAYMYQNKSIFLEPREFEHSIVNQKKNEAILGEITDGMIISQSFVAENDFSRIQIPFGTFQRQNIGTMDFELRDKESGSIINKQTINVQELPDAQNKNFDFEKITNGKGKTYEIILTSHGLISGNSVTVWKSSIDNYPLGQLKINDVDQNSDIRFKVINVEIKPLLSNRMFLMSGFIVLMIFIISSLLLGRHKNEIQKAFLITILPLGLVMTIIFPPFDQLDELEHFYRSYEVSEGKFLNQMTPQGLGNFIPASLVDTVSEVRYIHQGGYKYSTVKEAFGIKLNPDDQIFLRNYASIYPPILHLPQSLGIIVARIFFDSPLLMMYLGRIFNLLAYSTIAYIAIKIVPVKKGLFYLIALLPMAFVHASSLSADSITNSASLLFISYVLYLTFGKMEKIAIRHIVILILLGMIFALSKSVYFPLLFLVLLIPVHKYKDKKDYLIKFITVLAGCAIPMVIWNLLNIPNLSIPDTRGGIGVSPGQQVEFILGHPFKYIDIMFNTLMNLGPSQFSNMIGKAVTNYYYATPAIVLYTIIFMLFFLGIINNENESIQKQDLKIKDRLILLFIIFSVLVLTYTALYVGYTPVGNSIINGLQGRYFIPISSLIFLSLFNKKIMNKDFNLNFLVVVITHCLLFATVLKYIMSINA